jgi:hypothetical protein
MSICSICEKPYNLHYTTEYHSKCYDLDYKPVREIKKKPIKPQSKPNKPFKQPKPIDNFKIKKSLKIIIEKEYFPLIQVSYDPTDTTIYI